MSRSIEPYRDEELPNPFQRWLEILRSRVRTIPCYTYLNGSPEGVIAGQQGDLAYDRVGLIYYQKSTASGKTGWIGGGNFINGVIAGDPGLEGSGIVVGGVLYDSALKVSDLGGAKIAQFILHRHSTTLGPAIIGSRSNSDDETHALVADSQQVLAFLGAGWDGTNYEAAGILQLVIDGAPGANDMPGRWEFLTTANGGTAPVLALRINSNQRVDFQTSQALGAGVAATLGTIGGTGPTAAAQAQWLEIEIAGVVHWIPAWV